MLKPGLPIRQAQGRQRAWRAEAQVGCTKNREPRRGVTPLHSDARGSELRGICDALLGLMTFGGIYLGPFARQARSSPGFNIAGLQPYRTPKSELRDARKS